MKAKRITITEDMLKSIAMRVSALPEKTSQREVSAREAVLLLKKEIQALQRRGYTIEEVAEFLTGEGLPISSATLRSYMQRTSTRRKRTQNQTAQDATTAHQHKKDVEPQQSAAAKGRFTARLDTDDI